ncbi:MULTISPECIES: hypothetical protein [Streptomyces]|uniref:hypothetical protein n=1 Tax=Streptomyces TaxID=1883 RepID=UPI001FCC0BDE|nr:hypothetical protein [Streptomyces hygroscopicus]BDH11339.1 hypothetical protein HOK021_25180 [Streptomyces hygroscopicus]
MPDSTTAAAADGTTAAAPAKRSLGTGPGRLLVALYGIFTVAAASRSLYQLIAQFDRAPLAYSLSALSAVVYGFITFSLVRGGEGARRAAFACCALELLGVLGIGTWTLLDRSAFPDATVWSDYGMGYLFIPVILPVTGLMWLRRARTEQPA